MPRLEMTSATGIALVGAAAFWLLATAPAALAEDQLPAPPAATTQTGEVQNAPAEAAPEATGQTTEEGAIELNEAPSSVVPGYGNEPNMCPHHRGAMQSPSV